MIASLFDARLAIAETSGAPRTPSRKIQKKVLIASAADLRADAYDRPDKCWR